MARPRGAAEPRRRATAAARSLHSSDFTKPIITRRNDVFQCWERVSVKAVRAGCLQGARVRVSRPRRRSGPSCSRRGAAAASPGTAPASDGSPSCLGTRGSHVISNILGLQISKDDHLTIDDDSKERSDISFSDKPVNRPCANFCTLCQPSSWLLHEGQWPSSKSTWTNQR